MAMKARTFSILFVLAIVSASWGVPVLPEPLKEELAPPAADPANLDPAKKASKKDEDDARFQQCAKTLAKAGVSDTFGSNVGHAIHSITLRDLQGFDPEVPVKNGIPIINLDLTADNAPILPDAPDLRGPDEAMFTTDGMKTLDLVLSHMDNKKWDLAGFTPLEKVVHAFHMKEVWAATKPHFLKLKEEPPSAETCDCVTDVYHNGIMKMLRFTALAIKNPILIYGVKPTDVKSGYIVHYTYHFFLKQKEIARNQPGLSPELLLHNPDEAMPRLTSEKTWKRWKEIGHTTEAENKDVALYLFCALKKAKEQK